MSARLVARVRELLRKHPTHPAGIDERYAQGTLGYSRTSRRNVQAAPLTAPLNTALPQTHANGGGSASEQQFDGLQDTVG